MIPTLLVPNPMEGESSTGHLDVELVGAYLEHRLSGAELVAAEAHLASCPSCRAEIVQLSAVLQRQTRPRLRYVGGLTAAAAAAVLLLVVSPRSDEDPPSGSHRAAPAAIERTVEIVSPKGVNTSAREWSWKPAAGADRYEITVFDADGRVVWDTSTTQTLVSGGPTRLEPGRPYFWRVRARVGWDRWLSSEFAEFTPDGTR